ncbi:MAG: ATP-binding protein [Limnobacter sp.]|nr:ATP-binding protein [Limnobacter sp.]
MKNAHISRYSIAGIFAVVVLFVALFCLVQISPLLQLQTPDQVVERAYWIESGESSINPSELRSKPFKAVKGTFAKGNLQSEAWMRVRVNHGNNPSLLVVRPAFSEELYVYQEDEHGQWIKHSGGLRLSSTEKKYITQTMTVPVILTGKQETQGVSVLYVHIRSATAYFHANAYPTGEYLAYNTQLSTGIGMYLGVSLLFVSLCLVLWLVTSDRVWLEVVLYDFSCAFFAATQSGALFSALPGVDGVTATSIYTFSVILVTFAMCRFNVSCLQFFRAPSWLTRFYQLCYLPAFLACGLVLVEQHAYALMAMNTTIAVSCVVGLYGITVIRGDDPVVLNIYRVFSTLYAVVPLWYVVSNVLQLTMSSFVLFLASGQNNIFTLVMVVMMVGYRAWQKALRQMALQTEKEILSARLIMEEEKLKEASSFLSMIVHELKNPLNFIRLASSNLAEKLLNQPETTKVLQQIQSSVSNIDNVLERSQQVDAQSMGKLVIQRSACDLGWLVRDTMAQFEDDERIYVHGPAQLAGVVDMDLLALILRNLLENALKYSEPGTEVELVYEKQKDIFRLNVLNTVGRAGYPDPGKLFHKFYRSSEAMHVSGSGLGLYWVKQVVRMMDGDIQYAVKNKRICFEVWIPC